jgi:two-component sensor histidine kinase
VYNVHANNVRLALDLEDVILEIDKAIPCGMIINELVSNCLKHAFEGRKGGHITITVRVDEGRKLAMSVADDGSGFPAHIEFPSKSSLGLRLVQMLTDQLKGNVAMDRTNGTMFTILFPIP